ncbi:hypothetical protein Gotur_035762 [Gossypium turneri]
MVQCLLNEQPTHETLLAHIFQIRHLIQIPKLVPRIVELPEPDQKHIYRTIHFFSKLCISWIVSWNYSYEQDQYTGIPLLVRTTGPNGATNLMMKNMIQNIWIIFSTRI